MVDYNGGRIPAAQRKNGVRMRHLKHLTKEHKEIIRLSVLGVRPSELAERFGRHASGISLILNSDISIEYANSLTKPREEEVKDARSIIERSQVPAAQALVDSIDDKSVPYSEKYKNARWLLDAGGNGPKQNQQGDGAYTRDRVTEIIAGVLEAAKGRLEDKSRDARLADAEDAELLPMEESTPALAGVNV